MAVVQHLESQGLLVSDIDETIDETASSNNLQIRPIIYENTTHSFLQVMIASDNFTI